MSKNQSALENLSDEQILDEFVKRFECDGAILIYLDSNIEYGFGRWRNKAGKKWVDYLLNSAKANETLSVGDENKRIGNTSVIIS